MPDKACSSCVWRLSLVGSALNSCGKTGPAKLSIQGQSMKMVLKDMPEGIPLMAVSSQLP